MNVFNFDKPKLTFVVYFYLQLNEFVCHVTQLLLIVPVHSSCQHKLQSPQYYFK